MSRHRFVRNMSRSYDEVDAYDHFGGHSYEDAMSPSASEFVYQRTPSASLGDFLPSSNTEESMIETETEPRAAFDPSTLSEEQQVLLASCMDHLYSVLGDSFPEEDMVDMLVRTEFDAERAISCLLDGHWPDYPQSSSTDAAKSEHPELVPVEPELPLAGEKNASLAPPGPVPLASLSSLTTATPNLSTIPNTTGSLGGSSLAELPSTAAAVPSLALAGNSTLGTSSLAALTAASTLRSAATSSCALSGGLGSSSLASLAPVATTVPGTLSSSLTDGSGGLNGLSLASLAASSSLAHSTCGVGGANSGSTLGGLSLASLAATAPAPTPNLESSGSVRLGGSVSLASLAAAAPGPAAAFSTGGSNSLGGPSLASLAAAAPSTAAPSMLANNGGGSSLAVLAAAVPVPVSAPPGLDGSSTSTMRKTQELAMPTRKFAHVAMETNANGEEASAEDFEWSPDTATTGNLTAKSPSMFAKVLTSPARTRNRPLTDNMTLPPRPKDSPSPFQFDKPSPDDVVLQAQKASEMPLPVRSMPIPQATIEPEEASVQAPETRALKVVATVSDDLAAMGLESDETQLKDVEHPSAKVREATMPRKRKGSKNKLSQKRKDEIIENSAAGKPLLNLVVVGHVDAGKSTLMGHLLFERGDVAKKLMHKYRNESQKIGKSSFAFAWVLDQTGEERERGITMDVAHQHFETESRSINLLDAPGHKDFIPNMISGTTQADAAVLVINATPGEFESGFDSGGQTREHAILVRSLGISELIVAVNKMDTIDWEYSRFNEIIGTLKTFLKLTGFREKRVHFVPCSGFTGGNLVEHIGEMASWYKGPTILEAIDCLTPPERDIEGSTRMVISDVYKGQGSGIALAGSVLSGIVGAGTDLVLQPSGEVCTVKTIDKLEEKVPWSVAGDNVILTVTGLNDIDFVSVGSILADPEKPVPIVTRVRVQVITFNLQMPLIKGQNVMIHYLQTARPASIRRLVSQTSKATGEVIKKKPRALVRNSAGVLDLEFERPLCIELYSACKDLGRMTIRMEGVTVAAGVVLELRKLAVE